MQRIIFCLIVLFTLLATPNLYSDARKKDAMEKLVTVAPVALMYGRVALNGEIALNDKSAFQPHLDIWNWSSGDWELSWTGLGASYHIFPNDTAPAGFFWGPKVDLMMISAKYAYTIMRYYSDVGYISTVTAEESKGNIIVIGIDLGYRWIFKGGFTIDLGGNVYYGMGEVTVANQKAPVGGAGIAPTINIGLAF